jgi:hypothetical protein
MIPVRTPQTPRVDVDVDLHKTQRTFLFAREQVAAQINGYCAVRRARHWSEYHEHPAVTAVTNAPDSPAPAR